MPTAQTTSEALHFDEKWQQQDLAWSSHGVGATLSPSEVARVLL